MPIGGASAGAGLRLQPAQQACLFTTITNLVEIVKSCFDDYIAPVFQSGKSDQMVSVSSVLELEVNQNMFLNRLTRTYM